MLAKGREKSLLRRHPWVFSGAVARMEGKASLGETIDIVDHQGKWLARGAYHQLRKSGRASGRLTRLSLSTLLFFPPFATSTKMA